MQLIKNALLFEPVTTCPIPGSLFIQEENFVDISNEEIGNAKIIDAENKWLIPGFMDLDCHLHPCVNNLLNLSRSALKGGFTSLCILPDTEPVLADIHSIKYLLSKVAEQNLIEVFPVPSITKKQNPQELVEMQSLAAAGIKAFHFGAEASLRMLQMAFLYAEHTGSIIFTSPYEESLAQSGVMNYGESSLKLGLKGIPVEAETVMLTSQLELLRSHPEIRLHINQISSARSVELIRQAKRNGLKVTAGVSPWHLAYTDQIVKEWDSGFKLLPPLRAENDRQALIEGLKDGSIDVIVSGHQGKVKNKSNLFAEAGFGKDSLEETFSVCFEALIETGLMQPIDLIRKLTLNPRQILFPSENKRYFQAGSKADFVLIDLKTTNKHKIFAVYKNGQKVYSQN